jgi:fumarate reductase iron-sulfur subunit
MTITVCGNHYKLEDSNTKSHLLLSALLKIKQNSNRSLAFRSGCKSGVCGSCAVRVNGVETLACKTTLKNGDIVEPLNNSIIIKDLVVDITNQDTFLKLSKSYLVSSSHSEITQKDEKKVDVESNCILCSSCFSACPVYTVNKDFVGPFALTRNYRYVNDTKENEIKTKIDAVQSNGIWDCTLCGNCNMVCPALIDIKGDIEKLRNISAQFGYNNPNMNMGFDTQDFGFNPNGF